MNAVPFPMDRKIYFCLPKFFISGNHNFHTCCDKEVCAFVEDLYELKSENDMSITAILDIFKIAPNSPQNTVENLDNQNESF